MFFANTAIWSGVKFGRNCLNTIWISLSTLASGGYVFIEFVEDSEGAGPGGVLEIPDAGFTDDDPPGGAAGLVDDPPGDDGPGVGAGVTGLVELPEAILAELDDDTPGDDGPGGGAGVLGLEEPPETVKVEFDGSPPVVEGPGVGGGESGVVDGGDGEDSDDWP